MPSTQNAVNNHEYRSVPITALAESDTNPRKRFDPKSLEELAASFKTQGILAPLLVRELEESKYEVVAGARRLGTSPQSGETGGTRKTSRPRGQADGCRGNRGPVR
ncbi:MAG: ParB N-terminal domain-containing protein [Candidatus Sulfotelmatobacter sp.]